MGSLRLQASQAEACGAAHTVVYMLPYVPTQAVALVQGADLQQQIGLAVGTAVTAVLLVRSGKRFVDTPDDPSGTRTSSATAALRLLN